MWKKTVLASLVLGGALTSIQAPVLAVEAMQDDWAFMMSMKGMVSKKEFLDMMAKAYDMKAREMKADRMGMTDAALNDFLKSLYVGG
jgi:hypothetical protein